VNGVSIQGSYPLDIGVIGTCCKTMTIGPCYFQFNLLC